jgi:uncharacterized Zn finger protein
MEKIQFLVQGSAAEPYKVTFQHDGSNLSAYCTCPAGDNGQNCKHRFAILDGSDEKIVSNNKGDVKKVKSWLPGSDVEQALVKLAEAEEEFEEAKRKLSDAKKKVAASFRN